MPRRPAKPSDDDRADDGADEMAGMVRDPKTGPLLEKLLRSAAWMGDLENLEVRLSWGIDPNAASAKLHRTALHRHCFGPYPSERAVKMLLTAGADPTMVDGRGMTALDYARRRLARYEGKPRKPPRRSPSLTPQGDVKLHPEENRWLEEVRRDHPEMADRYEEEYLRERRKVAERSLHDVRGELDKIVPLLEAEERKWKSGKRGPKAST